MSTSASVNKNVVGRKKAPGQHPGNYATKKSSKRNRSDTIKQHGRSMLSAPSTSSATGLLVTTRYEIDTNLFANWTDQAKLYQFWKINKLTFIYKTQQTTTHVGLVFMSVLDDVEAATPGTEVDCISQRVATFGSVWVEHSLVFKPETPTKWYFTADNLSQDDRLEMPGDFVFGTFGTNVAVVVGRVEVVYEVSFRGLTTSGTAVSLPRMIRSIVDKEFDERFRNESAEPEVKSRRSSLSIKNPETGSAFSTAEINRNVADTGISKIPKTDEADVRVLYAHAAAIMDKLRAAVGSDKE